MTLLMFCYAGGSAKRKVALVGKGLTFDSGGYNLKVGGMIEMMKFDKGGACAVLGAAYAISQMQPADAEVGCCISKAQARSCCPILQCVCCKLVDCKVCEWSSLRKIAA